MKTKLVVVVGPTASGKSALAVKLAKEIGGEVISADSRQIYKGLALTSGQIKTSEMEGVPHHLLSIANPKHPFSVVEYKTLAQNVLCEIVGRGKTPILCGGTGFYIDSVVNDISYPNVPPNPLLRNKLNQKSIKSLFQILQSTDKKRANTIDPQNRQRMIRSIEIASALGSVPKQKEYSPYDAFQIGLSVPRQALKCRIQERAKERVESGMIDEVKKLHRKGLSYQKMEDLGLDLKVVSTYIREDRSKSWLIEELARVDCLYAKRQMTWFRRSKNIHWFAYDNTPLILNETKKFFSPYEPL